MAKEDAQYVRIQRSIWNKPRFRALSEDAQRLYLYIAICPHGNMTGFFVLRPGYALEDLGWEQSPERFTKGLEELLTSGHVKYDFKNKVVLDLAQMEKFPLQNDNQVKGAISKLKELPFTPLLQDLKLLVTGLGKPLYKPLDEWLCQRLGKYEDVDVTVDDKEKLKQPDGQDFILPSFDEILFSSGPKTKGDLQKVCKQLYGEKIFPEVYAFTNQHLKAKKNPKAIIHSLARCVMNKPKEPWGYCLKIINVENGNYNERDNA